MAKVLGLGYIALDVWGAASGLGECVGGSTANTLALLAHLGHRPTLLGAMGDDEAGRRCVEELSALRVDVRNVLARRGRRTKRIGIEVGRGGERRFHISRGNVAAAPTWREVAGLGLGLEGFELYHSALATRCSLELARRVRPASYNGQRCYGGRKELALHREMIEACDVVVFSHRYLRAVLGGRTGTMRADVLGRFEGPVLKVVTLGASGLVASCGGRTLRMPALDLRDYGLSVTDTTGAGDAFHAGLLHRLLSSGRPVRGLRPAQVEDMCRFGAQVAAFACSRYGTKNALPEEEYARLFGASPSMVETDPSREIMNGTRLAPLSG